MYKNVTKIRIHRDNMSYYSNLKSAIEAANVAEVKKIMNLKEFEIDNFHGHYGKATPLGV